MRMQDATHAQHATSDRLPLFERCTLHTALHDRIGGGLPVHVAALCAV